MKIALFVGSMGIGGAERVTAHLVNAWADRGWEVTLVTLAPQSLDCHVLRSRVKRVALDLAGDSGGLVSALRANIQRIRHLRKALADLHPDIVIAMMTSAAVVGILATRGLGCRVMVSERVHPGMHSAGWLWDHLRRLTYPRADRVVMQSAKGLQWLKENIPGARGVVIPNPVPFPLPAGEPLLRPEQFVEPGRELLLAVGRLDEQKGFGLLLQCFAALASRCPTWDLAILGEGPQRARLEQQVAALGLGRRVALPGQAGNIGDWYARAHLYVMSSLFEGFPNTLAEAMAHGCAAVSYDCDTGPGDIIRHERDGLLVSPVGDVAALTRALERLMGGDEERQRMAARAIEVRGRYSPEKILSLWDALFTAQSG